VAAGELLPGYELVTAGGGTARVESIGRREGRFKVYNFEVADSHTYFISPLGVLVHNQCPPTIKVKDLDPLHSPETSGARPELEKLSDSDLLESVINPSKGDPMRISTQTGKVVDGNGRAYELMRRAADPNSSISPNTRVPYVPYTPGGFGFPPLP
jgi:hypothetical protein